MEGPSQSKAVFPSIFSPWQFPEKSSHSSPLLSCYMKNQGPEFQLTTQKTLGDLKSAQDRN